MSTDLDDEYSFKYVKWLHADGTVHFGHVEIFALDQAEKDNLAQLKAAGKAIVDDAITAERWIVKREKLEIIGIDDYCDMIDAEGEKAYKRNEENNFQVAVGTVFAIGVADGAAHYVITKVNKKTCKIEWRGYCVDRYTDRILKWGGTFPISLIEPLIVKRPQVRRKRLIRFDGKPIQK